MIPGRPSETALQVAAARAAHLRFDPDPHLLEDVCALDLLGSESAGLIEGYSNDGPWMLVENRLFISLRARYFEDRMRAAHDRGVRQVVVLGAGLDSLAFRQTVADVEIFEVDFPSTQEWKQARLDSLNWAPPRNLHFVPCDFEATSLPEVLRETCFDPTKPSVVSWMGVVYYLQKETVAAALADLESIMAKGSELVFDLMRPWEELSERYQEIREIMARFLESAGEPHVNRYTRDEIVEVILAAGFEQAIVEEREDLIARYIAPLQTSIPLSERFRLVAATK